MYRRSGAHPDHCAPWRLPRQTRTGRARSGGEAEAFRTHPPTCGSSPLSSRCCLMAGRRNFPARRRTGITRRPASLHWTGPGLVLDLHQPISRIPQDVEHCQQKKWLRRCHPSLGSVIWKALKMLDIRRTRRNPPSGPPWVRVACRLLRRRRQGPEQGRRPPWRVFAGERRNPGSRAGVSWALRRQAAATCRAS
jgi:hypothetical protein